MITKLTEEDIKFRYISPAIKRSCWDNEQFLMEYYFTDGQVLVDGKESRYGSAYKKTLTYEGKVVEVTFQKLKDGVVSISNGWVK